MFLVASKFTMVHLDALQNIDRRLPIPYILPLFRWFLHSPSGGGIFTGWIINHDQQQEHGDVEGLLLLLFVINQVGPTIAKPIAITQTACSSV
jgi:hypothetical protein